MIPTENTKNAFSAGWFFMMKILCGLVDFFAKKEQKTDEQKDAY